MTKSTLIDVLNQHAQGASSNTALHCWNASKRDYIPVSYKSLSARAFAFGEKLIDQCQSKGDINGNVCLLYTSPSPRDATLSRMPSSA